jgi:predicted DNA binding CopG/RHH family protein
MPKPLKKVPVFNTDEEAEHFVETADLTEYDPAQFKPMHFELRKKDARVNMRLPVNLLSAVKDKAKKLGIPYQRLIRQSLEEIVSK